MKENGVWSKIKATFQPDEGAIVGPDFRSKQEETLMREIGFIPVNGNWYVGSAVINGEIKTISVFVPQTFPYSKPKVYVDDADFYGLHQCVFADGYGVFVHIESKSWKPSMHIAELTTISIAFLKSLCEELEMKKLQKRGVRWNCTL
jgi:hypothetical protein